jgi:hypothetical protein
LHQRKILESKCPRRIIRAGRRSGKTVCAAILAVEAFLGGHRVLYAAPTDEQKGKFWYEVKRALDEPIRAKIYKLNEAEDYIERVGTENRLKAKTAWNSDSLRGDFCKLLILDEWQLMNEDAWELVGAPMLLDNNGDAVFIYTPPSLRSTGVSKARDPRHAAKMFKEAQKDTTGRWQAIHFTSHDNPFISQEALGEIIKDMSKQSYRQEILAEDDDIQLSWLVYRPFNEDMCKIQRFEIPKTWNVYSGHDFGAANPAALFFAQVKLPLPIGAPRSMRPNDLVAFREYLPGGGFSEDTHVANWKEITNGYQVRLSAGGNVTTEEEIRHLYGRAGWAIAPPSVTKVNAQLDKVVSLMEFNQIYVFNDLYHYLEELMNCLWEIDADGKPSNKIKNEKNYHLCAAVRVILSSFNTQAVREYKHMPTVTYCGF